MAGPAPERSRAGCPKIFFSLGRFLADPRAQTGGMMNATRSHATGQQLELGFAGDAVPHRPAPRTESRSPLAPERARWWFTQIRRGIALAAGRTAPARPEQVYLTLPAPGTSRWAGPSGAGGWSAVWQS